MHRIKKKNLTCKIFKIGAKTFAKDSLCNKSK